MRLQMSFNLFEYQQIALDRLKTGSILCGGVGSGKSRTALAYYFIKECGGRLEVNGEEKFAIMNKPKDLYIITTARKRDTLDWERECIPFLLSTKKEISLCGIKVVIDSWNNIQKYKDVENAFFIFDEQRVVGSGAWVKAFVKISKSNNWILLSATPGDTWMDYAPVFVANRFYKNKTEFVRRHVVYSRYSKYPKIDKYLETAYLEKLRRSILIEMKYSKHTTAHSQNIFVEYDKNAVIKVTKERWNIYKDKPIKSASELCYTLRKIVNSDPSRIKATKDLILKNPKVIIFYNFDYELNLLRELSEEVQIPTAEWNGHKHEPIPNTSKWVYLVQYTAGAEGWNCVDTNVVIFYSQNYSYKIKTQSAGRIDRLNTPYSDLYYWHIRSKAPIDLAIFKALSSKKNFNATNFVKY